MLDNGWILHLICRTSRKTTGRSRRWELGISWLLRWETLRLGVGNPMTRTNRTIMRVVTPRTDRRLTLKKMRLDWSRWFIAVHFRVFPRSPSRTWSEFPMRSQKNLHSSRLRIRTYLCKTKHNISRCNQGTVSLTELIFWLFRKKKKWNIKV